MRYATNPAILAALGLLAAPLSGQDAIARRAERESDPLRRPSLLRERRRSQRAYDEPYTGPRGPQRDPASFGKRKLARRERKARKSLPQT